MGFDCLTAAIDKKLDSVYFRIRWVSALIEHGRQQERKKGNTEERLEDGALTSKTKGVCQCAFRSSSIYSTARDEHT